MLISSIDYGKIMQQIRRIEQSSRNRIEHISLLKEKLSQACKVPPQEIPPNVVTMNSIVLLKQINSSTVFHFKLVYPDWENQRAQRLSIFSTLGMAVFLRKVGDEISGSSWKKNHQVKILDIPFQPEACGHFLLKNV